MNCDRLAPWYRWLEYGAFGRALEHRRNAFLPQARAARRALLLGDGDGRFAARLWAGCNRTAALELTCVDSSAVMLELARCRLRKLSRDVRSAQVQLVHADARVWLRQQAALVATGAAQPFDLIVTHFFLDCFAPVELPGLSASIAGVAAPNARWLISEFRQPAGHGPRAWHAAFWLSLLYPFFRLTTGLDVRRLPDHRPPLVANGFRLLNSETARAGLLVSEHWERAG